MRQIINQELEKLRTSEFYVFSGRDFPNQVFSKKFDTYIFMEDVHIKANEFFPQFKSLEEKIGGSKIFLHTMEPYLSEAEQSEYFVKDFIPPCFELSCKDIENNNEIWNTEWENGCSYNINRLQIVFGETGKWACYFSSMYDEYGIIGIDNSIIDDFNNCAPYVLEKCFHDIENLLEFVHWLTRDESVFLKRRELLLTNYDTSWKKPESFH